MTNQREQQGKLRTHEKERGENSHMRNTVEPQNENLEKGKGTGHSVVLGRRKGLKCTHRPVIAAAAFTSSVMCKDGADKAV